MEDTEKIRWAYNTLAERLPSLLRSNLTATFAPKIKSEFMSTKPDKPITTELLDGINTISALYKIRELSLQGSLKRMEELILKLCRKYGIRKDELWDQYEISRNATLIDPNSLILSSNINRAFDEAKDDEMGKRTRTYRIHEYINDMNLRYAREIDDIESENRRANIRQTMMELNDAKRYIFYGIVDAEERRHGSPNAFLGYLKEIVEESLQYAPLPATQRSQIKRRFEDDISRFASSPGTRQRFYEDYGEHINAFKILEYFVNLGKKRQPA
ncbi:MAG: hypothetical protein ACUVXI_10725 [bacterium]